MKNSKDYSAKIKKLYSSLKRNNPKPEKVAYDTLLDAMVYAIISENVTKKAAKAAVKNLKEHFVDLNDLRVSRAEEITEIFTENSPEIKKTVSTLSRILRAVFNKYNTLDLEGLKKAGKRSAKQTLEELDATNSFIVSYCMLTCLQSHAIPVNEGMMEYLKDNGFVHPNADLHDVEGFLAKQIAAKNGYEFYVLLRKESESSNAGKKKSVKKPKKETKKIKKTTKAVKAKTKTTKKKTTKAKKTKKAKK